MANLSRHELQHLIKNRMVQTRNRQLTLPGMELFYRQIMDENPEYKMMSSLSFRKFIRGCTRVPDSWISVRHEGKAEIFFLTVKLCPMDKWKINQVMCGWLDHDHRCG